MQKNYSLETSILSNPLTEEQKQYIKNINPYIEKHQIYFDQPLDNLQDLIQMNYLLHESSIEFLLNQVRYRVLKHNIEKQQKSLTADEITALVKEKKIKKWHNLIYHLDLNLPWEEISKIYQDLTAIIALESFSPIKYFTNDQSLYKNIQEKNWKALCDYYDCMNSVLIQEKLKELGIESYIEKRLENINGKTEIIEKKFQELESKSQKSLENIANLQIAFFKELIENKEYENLPKLKQKTN